MWIHVIKYLIVSISNISNWTRGEGGFSLGRTLKSPIIFDENSDYLKYRIIPYCQKQPEFKLPFHSWEFEVSCHEKLNLEGFRIIHRTHKFSRWLRNLTATLPLTTPCHSSIFDVVIHSGTLLKFRMIVSFSSVNVSDLRIHQFLQRLIRSFNSNIVRCLVQYAGQMAKRCGLCKHCLLSCREMHSGAKNARKNSIGNSEMSILFWISGCVLYVQFALSNLGISLYFDEIVSSTFDL